jgi:hypothetical protein
MASCREARCHLLTGRNCMSFNPAQLEMPRLLRSHGMTDGGMAHSPRSPVMHRNDVMPSRDAVACGAIFYPVAITSVATIPSKRNNRHVHHPQYIQPLDTPRHYVKISMLRSRVIADIVTIPNVTNNTPAPPPMPQRCNSWHKHQANEANDYYQQ